MNLCKYSYNSTVPVTTGYLIIWKGTMTSWIFLAEETMIQNKFCEHYFTRRFSEQFRKANFFVTCTDRNNVLVAQRATHGFKVLTYILEHVTTLLLYWKIAFLLKCYSLGHAALLPGMGLSAAKLKHCSRFFRLTDHMKQVCRGWRIIALTSPLPCAPLPGSS